MGFGFGVSGGFEKPAMPDFDPLNFDPANPVKIPDVLQKPVYGAPVNKPLPSNYTPLQFGVTSSSRQPYRTTTSASPNLMYSTTSTPQRTTGQGNKTMLMVGGGIALVLIVLAVAS